MTESSSEALRKKLSKAQDDALQATTDFEQSAKRAAALVSECVKRKTATDEQVRALEDQIEVLTDKLKKVEETLTAPSSPELGSPKTQSDDEYIVVEPGSSDALEKKLEQREAEIRKAIAHAKKLEQMYNTAEERTLAFENLVQVLEANMFERFDDANALLEKVKELEELLTAGQIQIYSAFFQEYITCCLCRTSGLFLRHHRDFLQKIAALEEKSKVCDEAQKKVEYEKVLFLETEDQLVKHFEKAHDEAEHYRNMIFQLETTVKIAEEKVAHAEMFLESASQRNQELESEVADLNFQIQRISKEHKSAYEINKMKSDSELLELHKALATFQDKADTLEQELQMYRDREKKIMDDDVRSVDEKNVVHEATSSHLVDSLQKDLVGESMDGHAASSDLELDMARGISNSLDDDIKYLGEAHVTHSKLSMSEFAELQSAHMLFACEGESSKTLLKDHVKDLEWKVSELEQELKISRETEERTKQEAKVLEAKAMEECSFLEGLKMSYADYTCDLERKNSKLEEELMSLREKFADNVIEIQKATLDCDRIRNAESRSESLEVRIVDLQSKLDAPRECETCSQLKSQIQDLEVMLGELSLELEISRKREHDVQKEVKSMEEKSAAHEQLASEWMEKAASQVVDHNGRVQALEARMKELHEENLRTQTSINENRLWAEKAASLLREHAESLHELGEGFPDLSTTGKCPGKEEKEVLEAKVQGLRLKCGNLQFYDGPEALQLCEELLSLERDCLNFQMLDMASKNSILEMESEVLKSQIHNLQNRPESPAKEVKKSFREVTLDGEVQSLRAQLVELQSLRARVSEIPSLQVQLAQLQLSLRAAETRELEQNLELVKVQRKVSAADEEVCSLKSTLLNQTLLSELREQVYLLEQNLKKSETNNASLREDLHVYLKSKSDLAAELTEKATDEIFLEQSPESEQQSDSMPTQYTKSKTRRRKHRKSGKAPIVQERTQTADRISIFKHRIAVFLFSVFLVALVIRVSWR